jgi:hypothetical protein
MKSFRQWLEHDYLYDDLDRDILLGSPNQKAQSRLAASQSFFGSIEQVPNPQYDPNMPVDPQSISAYPPKEYQDQNPNWRQRYDQFLTKKIAPQIDLANKRIVLSKYRNPPIAMPISNQSPTQDPHHGRKPFGGLWYAFGNDWIGWSQQVPERLRMFVHEIVTNKNKMLVLDSKEKTNRFEQDYGIKRDLGNKYEMLIDWPKLSTDYGGIELQLSAMHFIDWQENWDIASGCVWDQSAIADTRLLYVYNVNNNKYVSPRELGIYSGYSSKIRKPLP